MSDGERDGAGLVEELEEIILDCGYVHVEVPTTGPGSTYVVIVVPHAEAVYGDESEEESEEDDGQRLGYRGQGLDGSCAVRIYAIPDAVVTAEQRRVLERADGADLSRYEGGGSAVDPDVAEAALLVESWVGQGEWADRLALVYNNDPLTYAGPGVPDRPTGIVTIMLPASLYDEVASRY